MFFESALLLSVPGIRHGFGTISEEVPSPFSRIWNDAAPEWKQVHGTEIIRVTGPREHCGDADGLFCATPGVPIGIRTADCVPILLANKKGTAVAAIHAGWRGTKKRIVEVMRKHFSDLNENPRDWVAAIGPSIGPCCYEVSPELAKEFSTEFGTKYLDGSDKRYLDLQAINEELLYGIGLEQVEVLRYCCHCFGDGAPVLHSYRREGAGQRQYSLIGIGM